MGVALDVGRLLLSVVFMAAGVSKLTDLNSSRQAVISFGIPVAFARPLGVLVPIAEVGVSVALLPQFSVRIAAAAGCFMLLTFAAVMGVSLAQGRRPNCNCFGVRHSRPIGWFTLTRTLLLALIAGALAALGGTDSTWSAVTWVGRLEPANAITIGIGALLGCAIALQGWLSLDLLRQNGRLILRIEALEGTLEEAPPFQVSGQLQSPTRLSIGSAAPEFALSSLEGETVTLESLLALARPVLLLFTDPTCGPCTALVPEAARWQRDHSEVFTLVLVASRSREANQQKLSSHPFEFALLDSDRRVAKDYGDPATPAAVFVDTSGHLTSAVVVGSEAIRSLVSTATRRPVAQFKGNGNGHRQTSPLEIGQRVPALHLSDLVGRDVDLRDVIARDTLILFWNPACGYCQAMLPALRTFDSSPPNGAPDLVVVTRGDIVANAAMNLTSSVLLDPANVALHSFGAGGTPMAIRIDAQGRVASHLAAGAANVWELAGKSSADLLKTRQ